MKRIFFILVILCATVRMHAQEDFSDLVKIGDQLIISKPSQNRYQFIDIPRKNFIIKRGGIANMGSLKNMIVTITEIGDSDNPKVRFKKSSGGKFFLAYRTLTANLNGAINSGELKIQSTSNKDSLAK
ncbi:hypothetical protein [Croceitalea rosinachiae]|uniref:Uncharacterized protein n=1 Tax=Croceitalea rosinachiae TaxID=3075596 RepID=A0ABU3A8W8_9FLAO|nr:hypothetical protein [Croceitalea sp. F388]MDT0606626.1 hypothetical protein [Croceitalea sp. F388]